MAPVHTSEAGRSNVALLLDPEKIASLPAGDMVTERLTVDGQPTETGTYTGAIGVSYDGLVGGTEMPAIPVTLIIVNFAVLKQTRNFK